MEAKSATVNGVRASYGEGARNGPDLVFFTGFPDDWEGYQPLLEDLERDFHVFSPSWRGLGHSGHTAPYQVADWVSDVGGFVRDVVGAPVLGVGHSAGAWWGLSAAGRDPGLFSAFVALDIALNPDVHIDLHKTTLATYAGFAAAMQAAAGVEDLAQRLALVPSSRGGVIGDRATQAQLLDLATDLSVCDARVFDAWVNDDIRGLVDIPELRDWPGEFSGPVLFVYGDPEAGSMADLDARDYNQQRYPWAEVAEIPGTSHQLGLSDNPSVVTDKIRAYAHRL